MLLSLMNVSAHITGLCVKSQGAPVSLEPQCKDGSIDCHTTPSWDLKVAFLRLCYASLMANLMHLLFSLIMYFTFICLAFSIDNTYAALLRVLRELLFPC